MLLVISAKNKIGEVNITGLMQQSKVRQANTTPANAPANAQKHVQWNATKRSQGNTGSASNLPPPMYVFTIRGAPAFAELEVTLALGQTILADGGAMTLLREGVGLGEIKTGGVLNAITRGVSGESVFLNTYTGLSTGERQITFAAAYPGDMKFMPLVAGDEYVVARGSFLASSPNVTVTGKPNWRGVLPWGQDTGFVLPRVTCGPDGPGCFWLSGYGTIREHVLQQGQQLIVNNGRFLAASQHGPGPMYTVVQLGKTLMSTILGSEGLGMQFVGPCVVYTQSHDFDDLVRHISSRLPDGGQGVDPSIRTNVGTGVVAGVAGVAANAIASDINLFGGGRKPLSNAPAKAKAKAQVKAQATVNSRDRKK